MLGERLIQLRKARKWTQTDLAEHCGVSRNSIVNWETGKRDPKTSDIQKLATLFGVSPNDLIGNSSTVKPVQHDEKEINRTEPENYAYWGEVLDKTLKVAKRGDMQEISAITPLLKLALDTLLSVREQLVGESQGAMKGTFATVSAYNGNQSSYTGNTLKLS